MAELLEPAKEGRYLEVGTGTGADALELAEAIRRPRHRRRRVERDGRGGSPAGPARGPGRDRRGASLRGRELRRLLGGSRAPAPRRSGGGHRRDAPRDAAGRPPRRRRPRLRHAGRGRRRPGARPNASCASAPITSSGTGRSRIAWEGVLASSGPQRRRWSRPSPSCCATPRPSTTPWGCAPGPGSRTSVSLLGEEDAERWERAIDDAVSGGHFLYAFTSSCRRP